MCKETPKTKSTFVRVEIIRVEINASNCSKGPTSVSFKRTPEFVLELAFQEGYCIFSINNSLNPFSFYLAGPRIFCFVYSLYSMVIFAAIS